MAAGVEWALNDCGRLYMETLQELSDTLDVIDAAERLKTARDAATPFDHVQKSSGLVSARALATAIAVSAEVDEVWAVLRFHRKMGGEDLFSYFTGSWVFLPWMDGEAGVEVVDFQDLRERAIAWLDGAAS